MDNLSVKFGRYTLCRMIARGGMGEIYLAEYEGVAGFKKRCIIKKIRADLVNEPSFVERFLNEGRTLVALTHSNIVQIFDMGAVGDEYYLAMEYVSGADLRELMRNQSGKPLPVDIALAITREVLKGLDYAHHATDENGQLLGIVHRDISPSNILISEQGEVKIIDFGIAKAKTIESCTGLVQGKFAYMSPEQARGDHLDARTDLFSLGIVLYEMLTCVRPFEGDSDLQSLERIKCNNYRPIRDLRPELDEQIENIIAKALNRDIQKRYQNADAFLDALQQYSIEHLCLSGQREIISYFKPYLKSEAAVPPVPAAGGIDAALEFMLNAQSLGLQTTATRTLSPQSGHFPAATQTLLPQSGSYPAQTPSNPQLSGFTPNGMTPANFTPNGMTPANFTPNGMTPSSPSLAQSSGEHISLMETLSIPKPAEVQTGDPSNEIVVQPAEHPHVSRLKYIVIGALIALLISFVAFMSTRHISAPVEQPANLGNAAPQPAADVQPAAKPEEPQARARALGLPFRFETTPENTSIYVVEGIYRALSEKSYIFMPEQSIEVALQAPDHDACIIHIDFDPEKPDILKSYSAQNCLEIRPTITLNPHLIEIAATLRPAKKDPSAETAKENTAAEEKLAANTAETIPPAPAEKQTRKPVKPNDKSRKSSEKSNADQPISVHFSASMAGEISIENNRQSLPADITAKPGTPFEIYPKISGRKKAIPYRGKIQSSTVSVSFCEATVRINESYVKGDPAPYQLSDIFIDGTQVAHDADNVSLVLPCQPYTLQAKIQADGISLSAKETITPVSGKSSIFSITLHEN